MRQRTEDLVLVVLQHLGWWIKPARVVAAVENFVDHTLPAALGIVLLAACPGGTTSNMFSSYARGDVALSISLTA
ncbi:MAG: hypothetical protein ACPG4K_13755, partial [Haloferula sp.]